MTAIILDLLTALCALTGLFFMGVGALGLVKLPDLYMRMHATGKCVTLGVIGLLLAAACQMSQFDAHPTAVVTKVVILIIFLAVAAPVGTHMLARAAHRDGVEKCPQTIDDELKLQ